MNQYTLTVTYQTVNGEPISEDNRDLIRNSIGTVLHTYHKLVFDIEEVKE